MCSVPASLYAAVRTIWQGNIRISRLSSSRRVRRRQFALMRKFPDEIFLCVANRCSPDDAATSDVKSWSSCYFEQQPSSISNDESVSLAVDNAGLWLYDWPAHTYEPYDDVKERVLHHHQCFKWSVIAARLNMFADLRSGNGRRNIAEWPKDLSSNDNRKCEFNHFHSP